MNTFRARPDTSLDRSALAPAAAQCAAGASFSRRLANSPSVHDGREVTSGNWAPRRLNGVGWPSVLAGAAFLGPEVPKPSPLPKPPHGGPLFRSPTAQCSSVQSSLIGRWSRAWARSSRSTGQFIPRRSA